MEPKTPEPDEDFARVLKEKEEVIKAALLQLELYRERVAELGNETTPGDMIILRLSEIVHELVQVQTKSLEDERRLAEAVRALQHEMNIVVVATEGIRKGFKTHRKGQDKLDSDARKAYG